MGHDLIPSELNDFLRFSPSGGKYSCQILLLYGHIPDSRHPKLQKKFFFGRSCLRKSGITPALTHRANFMLTSITPVYSPHLPFLSLTILPFLKCGILISGQKIYIVCMYEGGSRLTWILFFTKRIYIPEMSNSSSFLKILSFYTNTLSSIVLAFLAA
jgi:hypothetical protein